MIKFDESEDGSRYMIHTCVGPYPCNPVSDVATRVDSWLADRPWLDERSLSSLNAVFARACTANGATDIRYLPVSPFAEGTQTLAVANGPGWTCALIKHERGVGVAGIAPP